MAKTLNITAISGWAVPRKWFASEIKKFFPKSNIEVIYPEYPENFEEAKNLLVHTNSDLYIGYSLGSLWLLRYKELLPLSCNKALLAPILSFLDKDETGGGKTSETQLKYLSRIIKQHKNNGSDFKDFFSYAEIPFPEEMLDQLPEKETLLRGLDFLRKCSAKGEDTKLFLSILGENDIFTDGKKLKKLIPHLDIIQGVGHAPGALLEYLAKRLKYTEHMKIFNMNSDSSP